MPPSTSINTTLKLFAHLLFSGRKPSRLKLPSKFQWLFKSKWLLIQKWLRCRHSKSRVFEEDTATEYKKTVRTLNAYFVTNLNEPYDRHLFRSMTQQDGETVDQFIARLRKQAQNCNFNDPDVDITDQVLDKCRSSVLRRKLLGKVNLTLTKVQEVVRAMEAVDLQAKQMGEQRKEPLSVHKVVQKSPLKSSKQPHKKSGKGQCYRCGLAKQSVQSVKWWVIMQLCARPRQEVEQQTR